MTLHKLHITSATTGIQTLTDMISF